MRRSSFLRHRVWPIDLAVGEQLQSQRAFWVLIEHTVVRPNLGLCMGSADLESEGCLGRTLMLRFEKPSL